MLSAERIKLCAWSLIAVMEIMISSQFISQAYFPKKLFLPRLSICNYMPQQIIYPQVPKCSYLTFKRCRVDYSDDVGHSTPWPISQGWYTYQLGWRWINISSFHVSSAYGIKLQQFGYRWFWQVVNVHNLFLSTFLLTSQRNKETPTPSFL